MRKRHKVCFATLLQSRAMRYEGGHGGTVLAVADFIALLCDALNETQKQIHKGTLYMREQSHRTLLENMKRMLFILTDCRQLHTFTTGACSLFAHATLRSEMQTEEGQEVIFCWGWSPLTNSHYSHVYFAPFTAASNRSNREINESFYQVHEIVVQCWALGWEKKNARRWPKNDGKHGSPDSTRRIILPCLVWLCLCNRMMILYWCSGGGFVSITEQYFKSKGEDSFSFGCPRVDTETGDWAPKVSFRHMNWVSVYILSIWSLGFHAWSESCDCIKTRPSACLSAQFIHDSAAELQKGVDHMYAKGNHSDAKYRSGKYQQVLTHRK